MLIYLYADDGFESGMLGYELCAWEEEYPNDPDDGEHNVEIPDEIWQNFVAAKAALKEAKQALLAAAGITHDADVMV